MKKVSQLLSYFMALLIAGSAVMICTPQAGAAMLPNVSRSAPIKAYALKSSGRIQVYTNTACTRYNSKEYVDAATDECWILSLDTNNQSVLISYPAGSSRKERYVKASEFTSMANAVTSWKTPVAIQAQKKIPAYKRCSTGASYGSIYQGDTVYVLETSGSMTRVVYPTSSGHKMAWAKNSDLSPCSNGSYVLVSALNQNYCVDITGANGSSQVNVQLYSKNGTQAQVFQLTHVSNGWFKITNAWGKVLDVQSGSRASGTNVWTYDWNGSDAQLWQPLWNGNSYYLRSKLGCYLDVNSGHAVNGQNIHVYEFNGSGAQKFLLQKAGSTTPSAPSASTTALHNPVPAGAYFNKKTNDNGWYGYHDINIGVSTSTPVYAIADGTIVCKQAYQTLSGMKKLTSYGNYIQFTSADGKYTAKFCHLDRFAHTGLVIPSSRTIQRSGSTGTYTLGTYRVKKGDVIGYVGTTGNSSGIHLHLETFKNGSRVDPTTLFSGLVR